MEVVVGPFHYQEVEGEGVEEEGHLLQEEEVGVEEVVVNLKWALHCSNLFHYCFPWIAFVSLHKMDITVHPLT